MPVIRCNCSFILVDDYPRASWVLPLRTESDAPEVDTFRVREVGHHPAEWNGEVGNCHFRQREGTGSRKDERIL